MLKWLQRQFVPHEINGFRPLFLRRESALKVAGVLVVLELILFVLPTLYFPQYVRDLGLSAVLPAVLSNLTNQERVEIGLPTLTVSPLLARAAQLKAEDMAAKAYFAHSSPEGLTSWYWFDLVGYKYNFAGENLAINFSDSEEVTEAWMNSPTHQANIVGRNYTEVGTGIASGIYKDRETVFVVQLYGTPKAAPAVPKVSQNVAPTPQPASAPKTNSSVLTSSADKNLPPTPQQTQLTQVLGEETMVKAPNVVSRLMSSPKDVTDTVLYLALAIVIIAIFLNIAIKFEYQFPDLVANGAVVALLIVGINLGNNYFTQTRVQTSFLEYVPASEQIPLNF